MALDACIKDRKGWVLNSTRTRTRRRSLGLPRSIWRNSIVGKAATQLPVIDGAGAQKVLDVNSAKSNELIESL